MTPSAYAPPAVRPHETQPTLPTPRGPVTAALFSHLRGERPLHHASAEDLGAESHPLGGDAQLALYCIGLLTYSGIVGVSDAMEWDRSVLLLRAGLSRRFESAARNLVPDDLPPDPEAAVSCLLSRPATSLSTHLFHEWQARELLILKSAYLLLEADPHSLGIARADQSVKQPLMEIQAGEYGVGHRQTHAGLFAESMRAAGLRESLGGYLDRIPAPWLAGVNLMTVMGSQRRLRAALLGHLALTEMDSVGPNERYAAAFARLGMNAESRRWFDVHVLADAEHGPHAAEWFLRRYAQAHPEHVPDLIFGAASTWMLDQLAADFTIAAWRDGRSSLTG